MRFSPRILPLLCAAVLPGSLRAAENPNFTALENEFSSRVRPIVKEYCLGCHSTEKHKGDLDLERFSSMSEILKHPKAWEGVIEQMELGEMPPKDKPQPTAAQREQLLDWINGALDAAAQARAGDPGPVVLRRLNNAEYTYTVRDLTGIDSLSPAREFPADSSAGEGFMNTGNSLVMSPSMLTKYLDAGKEIASHAVLLPDGFRFSSHTSTRDWTEELLAEIRDFYRIYTDRAGAEKVNLQGIIFDTNEGGRLPVEKYLRVLINEREGLSRGGEAFVASAKKNDLSPKYLEGLWRLLNSSEPSLLMDSLRAHWREEKPDESAMVSEIQQWQKSLWKFATVGHIGKAGGPKAWMEPVNPLTTRQEVRVKLVPPTNSNEVVIYLAATDAGDGNEGDHVVWKQPCLIVAGRPNLALRDARQFIAESSVRRERMFASTAKTLAAVADASQDLDHIDVPALSSRHGVAAEDLSAWLNYFGLGSQAPVTVDYFTNQIPNSAGYDFVQGWGTAGTPLLLANSSDQQVRVPGNMKPHGVTVHPSPTRNVGVGWRSPLSAMVRVEAEVTHAHPECGNGVEWFLEMRRGKTRQRLAQGFAQGSQKMKVGPVENLSLQKGDLLSLVIGARDGNHGCDLTDIEFLIKSPGENREWNLTREVSGRILAGNPLADAYGNEATWHFYTEAVNGAASGPVIAPGSLLAQWQSLPPGAEKQEAAAQLQKLLINGVDARDTLNTALVRDLSSLGGPLFAGVKITPGSKTEPALTSQDQRWSLDPALFDKEGNLLVTAPSVLEIRLPADLMAGAEFVTEGALAADVGAEGSVQLVATTTKPSAASGLIASETTVSAKAGMWTSDNRQISYAAPLLVNEGSAARRRIEANLEEFRMWFPAALCYVKIVPVDEVVTLTLFYREDNHLSRLMLNDAEKARLDRLWDELHYVSHDAITLVDVFEQIWQYATQDADPKVFEPMRKPINDAAAAFRQRLIDTEPKHLDALLEFAGRANRRPLTPAEQTELRSLYKDLRAKEIPHDEAFRLTLARVFVGPAFLYRLERAAPGEDSAPVSDYELASRLSYALWSSTPDDELLAAAGAGQLRNPDQLVAQAHRMLKDPRIRRLATEFACAWLHIHDFESLDEKSERHFPTFANLRAPMYEESIQFFTDIFSRDASVLEIFDADYTFLNEEMAAHYGIPGVSGPEWRRVDGVKKFSRGGVLGLSATLAKQSGASRTSPILRGNWVAEALLGDKLPRPPKDVPLLPEDEGAVTLTVRQLVEKHSSDPRCAGCHVRIDGYGFAMEGFDAIGRARTKDLGDRPIETRAKLLDGTSVDGVEDLRRYLITEKRDVVLRQFCRKLLGYCLGRATLLSDKPLLAEMQKQLQARDYRFSAALETILRSRQFREIRGFAALSED